jgi:tetratricopeptide (TPR) repeat protein
LLVVVDQHKSISILRNSLFVFLIGSILLVGCSQTNTNSSNTIVHEIPSKELSSFATQLQVLNAELRSGSNPQNYFLRSKVYIELGNYDLALADINDALEQEENNGKFLWLKSEILFRKQKIKEAYEIAKRSENLGFKQVELFGTLAAIEMKQKAFPAAKKYIESSLKTAPYNGYIHYLKGLYVAQVQDSSQAIQHFKLAIEYKPKFVDSYKKLSEIYHKIGQTDLATELSLSLAKQYPNDADNNLMLGQIYKQRAKLDTALNYFLQAATINPKLYKANLEAGNIFLFYKNYSKALHHFQLCQNENPNKASLYTNLGICFEGLGKYTEALDNYTLAFTQNSTDMVAVAGIGRIEKRLYAATQPKYPTAINPTTPVPVAANAPNPELQKIKNFEPIKARPIKRDSTSFKVRIP